MNHRVRYSRKKNPAEIDSWVKFVEDDKRANFGAPAHAQPAVDYLCQLQGVDRVAA
jgi:antirestriction protein ArdC